MRASYTAGVVVKLIEHGIVFPFVAGISAGATNTLNYVSSDAWRARASFIDLASDPNFGNWRTFVQGKGLFHSDYIYRQTSGPDGLLPFNMDAFNRHPAELALQALRCSDGATVTWHRADMPTLDDILPRVQASSTMPVVMPPVALDGEFYVDGALGTGGGIALDAARAAGYTRFFVVLTQERGSRRSPCPPRGSTGATSAAGRPWRTPSSPAGCATTRRAKSCSRWNPPGTPTCSCPRRCR